MSEEQQAQVDKNTFDIRKVKNLVWILGILFTCVGTIWGLATKSANKDNAEANYKSDNNKHFDDMKQFINTAVQGVRTKDSTDIATVNNTMVNLNNSQRLEMSGQIRLLREQCRRMTMESKLSRTLHYHFDNNGNRVVESVENK